MIMSLLSHTSIIIVTYNHQDYIGRCLESLLQEGAHEIVVVDNQSTDNTLNIIIENFPQVNIIRSPENVGYSRGIDMGIKNCSQKYVVIINPDTWVGENSLKILLEPLKQNNRLITTPKALFYDGSYINTCGNQAHFTGLGFTRKLGGELGYCKHTKKVNALSGVCFALSHDLYQEMGGMLPELFLYMEDTEFSWRAHCMDVDILYVSEALIYHDYVLEVVPEKIYHLEKGRYIILRKYYNLPTYLLLAPSLLITEILTWGYAFLKGLEGVRYKYKALKDGLELPVTRMEVDRRKLIRSLDWKIPNNQLAHRILDYTVIRFANLIYYLNYRMII